MKTEKIKRKLKGSVLLTVVSVMGLLIIFLSGTLVLATAANRRAHRSYSTSQAELTAKAAIESFTTAMANNEQIAAAVQNLDKTYHPTVSINDPSLGHIGYYDASGNYIENAITIEPLSTSGKYVHGKFDLNNPSAEVWQAATQVKITVTARVGKEEKTVSALLNKVGLSNNVPSDDIGLYAGGETAVDATSGKIYSPFAEGLTTNGGFTCEIQNDTEFYSPVIFFNSGAKMSQQTIIHVIEPKQASVVRGDLELRNPFYVSLEYTMKNDYTQKDVPYLFVEGDIKGDGSGKLVVGPSSGDSVTNKSYSPYNIFAGSIGVSNPVKNMKVEGDIYLMDAGKTSVIGPETEDGGDLYQWADSVYNKTANQNYSTGGNIYSKGSIKFNQGIKVHGDVRVEGNVNFAKTNSEIWGDLIVGGTITGISNVYVHGTIYNDTLTGGATLKAGYNKLYGTYVPAGIGSQYKKVDNIKVSNYAYPNIAVFESDVETWTLQPSFMRTSPDGTKSHKIEDSQMSNLLDDDGNVPSVVYVGSNHEWDCFKTPEQVPSWAGAPQEWTVEEKFDYSNNMPTYVSPDGSQTMTVNTGSIGGSVLDSIMVDSSGNVVNNYDLSEGLKYYPVDKDGNEITGAAPVTDAESFFRADVDGNVTDERIPMGETWTYYLADVNGNAVLDGSGNGTIIDPASTPVEDLECTYYDMLAPGGPAPIAFASIPISTGYYEFSIPDPVDPSKNYTSADASIYVDASNNIVTEAEAMAAPGSKIEKIAAWTGKSGDTIYPAKMEKDIIYGSVVAGKFQKSTDTNQFVMTLDDMRSKISYRENAMGDYEFDSAKYPTTEPANVDKDYTDPAVQTNGVIKKSCVISGSISNKTIVIEPDTEIWVILDKVELGGSGEAKIVVNSNAGGDVKFFIKDYLKLTNRSSIYSNLAMKDNATIKYNQSLHIYYYGTEGSYIDISNNCLITGYGRCPKTSVKTATGTGSITVNYVDEHNNTFSIKPAWIGNVIYDGSHSANNLTFALVKEGGGGNAGTIKTGVGYFEYEYFSSN